MLGLVKPRGLGLALGARSAGGGAPAWVIPSALLSLDFVNERYWSSSIGEGAVTDFLEASSGWGGTANLDGITEGVGWDSGNQTSTVEYAAKLVDDVLSNVLTDAGAHTVLMEIEVSGEVLSNGYVLAQAVRVDTSGWSVANGLRGGISGSGAPIQNDVSVFGNDWSNVYADPEPDAIPTKIAAVFDRDTPAMISAYDGVDGPGGSAAKYDGTATELIFALSVYNPDTAGGRVIIKAVHIFGSKTQAEIRALTKPAWVPEGAITHIDFKNGQYYADGAVRSFAEMFSEYNNGYWDGYTIDPDDVTADVGWSSSGGTSDYALLSALAMTGWIENPKAFTVVMGGTVADSNYSNLTFTMNVGNTGADFSYHIASWQTSPGRRTIMQTSGLTADAAALATQAVRMAANYEPAGLALSVNGAAVRNLAHDTTRQTNFANPDLVELQANVGAVLEFVTIYPLQDEADLPSLSA